MANGIYIYAEQFQGNVEEYTAELVKAAKMLKMEMPITVFAFGKEELINQLQWKDVSVLLISADCQNDFQDDARAKILAKVFQDKEPAYIIVPATSTAKSLFSRVAVLLDVGMTADCTELFMDQGVFKQRKPAFGNEGMVVTGEKGFPAIVTLVTGIYQKEFAGAVSNIELLNRQSDGSGVHLIDIEEQTTKSIVEAEKVISLGKGVLAREGFALAEKLCEKMGAALGGTRPLVDNGMIPFEAQIGQTGCTIHPKSCLFFGVSGAIQHTEGVRNADITIAVNSDPDAAIFSFADYGVVGDAVELMNVLLEKIT